MVDGGQQGQRDRGSQGILEHVFSKVIDVFRHSPVRGRWRAGAGHEEGTQSLVIEHYPAAAATDIHASGDVLVKIIAGISRRLCSPQ